MDASERRERRFKNSPVARDLQAYRDQYAQQTSAPAPAPAVAPVAQAVPPSNTSVQQTVVAPVQQAVPAQAPQPAVNQNKYTYVPVTDYDSDEFGSAQKQTAVQDESAELRSEIESLRKQLEEQRALNDKYQSYQDNDLVDQYIAQNGAEFNSISRDDAKRLLTPMIGAFRKTTDAFNSQLKAQQDIIDKRFGKIDQDKIIAGYERTRSALLKAHPDLEQLQNTDAYKEIMLSPVAGNSNLLVGQLVASEFKRGNTDYINSVLDQVKAKLQTPDLNQVATVSANAPVGSAAPATETSGKLTPDQIAQYRFMVQNREMTRDEFREIMSKHREAERRTAR